MTTPPATSSTSETSKSKRARSADQVANHRTFRFAEYNLITDRHLAENFTIPAYTCGNVTRFGIATASDKNASPYMAPAQYEYDFDYYGSNYRSHPDFSYGYSTRCFKSALRPSRTLVTP